MGSGRLRYSSFRHEFRGFGQREPEDQERFQVARVNEILAQVWTGNAFYQGLHGEQTAPANPLNRLKDLAALPCLEKDHLRQELVLPPGFSPSRGTTKVQTTGTTGLPVTVYKNRRTHAAQIARRKLCFEQIGVQYGSREARFWGRKSDHQGPSLRDIILNRRTFTFLGSETDLLEEAAALLKFQPDYFYGYSTMILAASDLWEQHNLELPRLQAIVCTAESLTQFQRARISRVFGCPVFMEYGCSETDLIALQCREGNYHVPGYHVVVEIHPPGALAGEALVTDLTNKLMPLVRYRLGDQLTLAASPCACGQTGTTIAAISGRTLTQLVCLPDGQTVHAVVFAHLFEEMSDQGFPIARFKVWQQSPESFLIRVELAGQTDQNKLTDLLCRGTTAALSQEVAVKVRYEPIPAIPGEKFTYFVPPASP